MDKQQQRRIVKERLNECKSLDKADLSIAEKVISLKEFNEAKSIFIYLSMEKEVNTDRIISKAFSQGKRVFVPFTREEMHLTEIFPSTIFEKGNFDIREPKEKLATDFIPEIALIPLAGFDPMKNRLGRGKGYYDKYLQDKAIKKIALAYECQKFTEVATDSYDIKMDIIVTEEKIY